MKWLITIGLIASLLFTQSQGSFLPGHLDQILQNIIHHKTFELFRLNNNNNSSCPLNGTLPVPSLPFSLATHVSFFSFELAPLPSDLSYQSENNLFSMISSEEGNDLCESSPILSKYLSVVNNAALVLSRSTGVGSHFAESLSSVRVCVSKHEEDLDQNNILFGHVRLLTNVVQVKGTSQKQKQVIQLRLRKSLVSLLTADIPDFVINYYEGSLEAIRKAEASGKLTSDNFMQVFPEIMMESASNMFQEMFRDQNVILCMLCIIIGGTLVPLLANIIMYMIGLRLCELCELSESECTYLCTLLLYYVYVLLPVLAALLWQICKQFCVA